MSNVEKRGLDVLPDPLDGAGGWISWNEHGDLVFVSGPRAGRTLRSCSSELTRLAEQAPEATAGVLYEYGGDVRHSDRLVAPEDCDEVTRVAVEAGYSIREVADLLGVGHTAARRRIVRLFGTRPPGRRGVRGVAHG